MPTTEVDITWTPTRFYAAQRTRLLLRAAMAAHAASLPRRLGAGARANALDKRRCRRVAWASIQAFEDWGGSREELDIKRELLGYRDGFGVLKPGQVALARTAGATVQWNDYVVSTRAELAVLVDEACRNATHLGFPKEANQIRHRIDQEIHHLQRAIRDDTKGEDYGE